jgi:3-dehydroquinate synthase
MTLKYQHYQGITEVIFQSFKLWLSKNEVDAFIVDRNILKIYPAIIKDTTRNVYVFDAIEQNKTLANASKILNFFYKNQIDRSNIVAVIGGGITCDTGAFVASLWNRGIRLVLVPTTLLAMVDASVGGKTAVNYRHVKNKVGTFYNPEKIIIDTQFLSTLPKNIYLQGVAETLKHALLFSEPLLHQIIEKGVYHIDEEIIRKNVEFKIAIVEKDPFEKNLRKVLNFGHTIGHAIEMVCNVPHGIAVATGMYLELKVQQLLGYREIKPVIDLLNQLYQQNPELYLSIEPHFYLKIFRLIQYDKKRCVIPLKYLYYIK